MLLLLQKIIIVLIAVFAAVLSILVIFRKDRMDKFLSNNRMKIRRFIFYLLIISIIISVINVTLSIIYMELHALFLLTLSLVLLNFQEGASSKRLLRVLCILFFIYVVMQFVYPMIS
jgi:hypothetical protein